MYGIVFEYGMVLKTNDVDTVIRACNMVPVVEAIVNLETKEILFGQLPDCMLAEEERAERYAQRQKAMEEKRKEMEAKERAMKYKNKNKHPA